MPTYITADDVRRATGAPTDLISDDYINDAIDLVEGEVARWLNTEFRPTQRIDVLDGNGRNIIFTDKNPLLFVRYLKTNDTEIAINELNIYKPSGGISLSSASSTSSFIWKDKSVIIKYLFGYVVDDALTTSAVAISAGTSVNMEVADSSSFSATDWVRIIGTDGNEEYCQITAIPDSTHITLDEVYLSHSSGSLVYKQVCPDTIKRFIEIESGINIAVYAIGGTYDFNTSYSLGNLSVNKGEPYPQWREVFQRLTNERKALLEKIKIRPKIV